VSSKPRTADENRRLKALGHAIRDVRKEHSVSQEALAHNAGIDRSHMGKIERGERNVTALNLLRVAKALGVQTSEIFSKAEL
jgi:transcriptional regulator with XRE-family HTH domain